MEHTPEEQAAATMDYLMSKVQPHLARITHLFGPDVQLTLVVRMPAQPGCLLMSNGQPSYDELIKAMNESKKMDVMAAAHHPVEHAEQ